MTQARTYFIGNARLVLARAVTITVRYTLIRRQFGDRDSASISPPEEALLEYTTVQIRVLPLLATTYALHYTAETMTNVHQGQECKLR